MTRFKMRSGTSVTTLLLILITVSLTVVAVLSLAAARQDADLTDRSAAMAEAYYGARSTAVKVLSQMAAEGETGTVKLYFDAGAQRVLTAEAELTDGRVLNCAFVMRDGAENNELTRSEP